MTVDALWNIAHKCYKNEWKRVARLFEIMSMTVSSHAISAQIEIGENSRFYHHGLGCVALETVHIGNNCRIMQNVTFGNAFSNKESQRRENMFEGAEPIL